MAQDMGIGDQIIRQFETLRTRIDIAIDLLRANRDQLPTTSGIGEASVSHTAQRELCHECIRLEVALEEATQSMQRLVTKSRGITYAPLARHGAVALH